MVTPETRTWAEVSASALEHNYRAIRGCLHEGCRFLGVVKANAYGHGAVPVAKQLAALGADYLAVACLEEAIPLREAGITLPILLLSQTPAADVGQLTRLDLTQAVHDAAYARLLSEAAGTAGKTQKIHLMADTGMTRLGFLCDDESLPATLTAAGEILALPHLDVEGAMTHFATADTDEAFTRVQFGRFCAFLDGLRERYGFTPRLRHCANSAACLLYPEMQLDMVRPGIILYGYSPDVGLKLPVTLRPVMTLKTRILSVKDVPAGADVSYGRTHTLKEPRRLAVLAIGYADGFHRACSDKIDVLIDGQRAPLLGRVCMDLCMVDVTDIPAAVPGAAAVVFGPDLPADEAAVAAGTISYELLAGLTPRVARIIVE